MFDRILNLYSPGDDNGTAKTTRLASYFLSRPFAGQ